MQQGDRDDLDPRELGWEELDAELSSSVREASMGFGTLLEASATPAPASFAEVVRRRGRQGDGPVPPRY